MGSGVGIRSRTGTGTARTSRSCWSPPSPTGGSPRLSSWRGLPPAVETRSRECAAEDFLAWTGKVLLSGSPALIEQI